jgi:hypothetical protein
MVINDKTLNMAADGGYRIGDWSSSESRNQTDGTGNYEIVEFLPIRRLHLI